MKRGVSIKKEVGKMPEMWNTAIVYVCRRCEKVYSIRQAQRELKAENKTVIIRASDFRVVVEINLGICDECLIEMRQLTMRRGKIKLFETIP